MLAVVMCSMDGLLLCCVTVVVGGGVSLEGLNFFGEGMVKR